MQYRAKEVLTIALLCLQLLSILSLRLLLCSQQWLDFLGRHKWEQCGTKYKEMRNDELNSNIKDQKISL